MRIWELCIPTVGREVVTTNIPRVVRRVGKGMARHVRFSEVKWLECRHNLSTRCWNRDLANSLEEKQQAVLFVEFRAARNRVNPTSTAPQRCRTQRAAKINENVVVIC